MLLAICSFTIAVVVPACASPCSSTQYDMMSWFEMGSSWSTEYHLTSNANPLYTYPGNTFYWVKGPAGYPWDVNYYDNNYIYQWATEFNWNDPTSYKAFNNAIPWSPRCVNKPASGVYGSKLATITLVSTPYTIYKSQCAASSQMSLGYVINEIWGPTPMSLGGSLPNNALTLRCLIATAASPPMTTASTKRPSTFNGRLGWCNGLITHCSTVSTYSKTKPGITTW